MTSAMTDGAPARGTPVRSLAGAEDVVERWSATDLGWPVLGVVALLAAWAAAARVQPTLILPSPGETLVALVRIASDGTLSTAMATTLSRAIVGVAIAAVLGALWGTVAGSVVAVEKLGRPVLSTLMALPPIVLVVVGLVWFGNGGAVPRFVIVMVALPLIVVAVSEAVRNLDPDLQEMAQVYEFSRWAVARHVVLPGIASPVLAALTITVGQSLRVSVMAELLASPDGVGALVARSRANLDTAQLFAWVFALVVVVILIENAVLRPLTRHILAWRDHDQR